MESPQGDIIPPSRNLHESGVELFAVGVKNVDENEGQKIASKSDSSTHVYNVTEFHLLHMIMKSLIRTVCFRMEKHGTRRSKT